MNGIWALKPYYLGPWTLREGLLVYGLGLKAPKIPHFGAVGTTYYRMLSMLLGTYKDSIGLRSLQ